MTSVSSLDYEVWELWPEVHSPVFSLAFPLEHLASSRCPLGMCDMQLPPSDKCLPGYTFPLGAQGLGERVWEDAFCKGL